MVKQIKNLSKDTVVYGLGGMGTKIISFLLLPLYLKYLTPADYGVIEITNVLTNILVIIFGFGFSSAVFREYYREDDKEVKRTIIGTAFTFVLGLNLVFFILLFVFGDVLANTLISANHQNYIFYLTILNVFFTSLMNLNFAVLRAEERPIKYSILNIIRTLIYALVNIYLVASLNRGYVGVREGIFISTFVVWILSFPALVKESNFRFSPQLFKRMLKFGGPLIISGLSMWLLNLTDRYMLKFLLDKDIAYTRVGIYSLAAKIASFGKLILVQPFALSWGVAMYKNENEKNAKEFYARVFKYFVLAAGLFYLLTISFSEYAVTLLTKNSDYYEALKLIAFLTGSALLSGCFVVLSVNLTIKYKNHYSSYATIIAAFTNIALNLILIPKYFDKGAAIASLISVSVMVFFQYSFGQRFYKIRYDLALFFNVIIYCVLVTLAYTYFSSAVLIKFIFVLLPAVVIYLNKSKLRA